MNNDYVILIDENGEPYLAHAWGQKKDHKYKLRVENYYGNGRHLYLYTDAEVAAFQKNGGKRNALQRVRDRVRDKLGWDERSELESAQKNTKEHAIAQNRYNQTLLGRVQTKKEQAKATGRAAKDIVSKYGRDTMKNVKNKANEAKTSIGTKAKDAAKWLDEHDAGLTETARYAMNRKTADQETKDRLHEDMTSTKIGRLASKVGSTPQSLQKAKEALNKKAQETKTNVSAKVTELGNSVKNAATNVMIKGKNIKVYYPSAVSSMSVEELINAGSATMGDVSTKALRLANEVYNDNYNKWVNAKGTAKAAYEEKLKLAETQLENARKEFVNDYNNFVDDHLKIKEKE